MAPSAPVALATETRDYHAGYERCARCHTVCRDRSLGELSYALSYESDIGECRAPTGSPRSGDGTPLLCRRDAGVGGEPAHGADGGRSGAGRSQAGLGTIAITRGQRDLA